MSNIDLKIYEQIAANYFSPIDAEQWRRIVTAGKSDPGLQDLLDAAIMYYKLKYTENER